MCIIFFLYFFVFLLSCFCKTDESWWVPGLAIGYEHSFVHQVADFISGVESGKPAAPTFRDALKTQRVCDAILDSGKDRRWHDVKKD